MRKHSAPQTHSFRRASLDSLSDLVVSLKKTVGQQLVRQFRAEVSTALICRAIDEAEQVARETEFPHLFLPELAAERVRRVHAFVRHDSQPTALDRAA